MGENSAVEEDRGMEGEIPVPMDLHHEKIKSLKN